MNAGQCLALNLENSEIDFESDFYDGKAWPSEKIFDFALWRKVYNDYSPEKQSSQ